MNKNDQNTLSEFLGNHQALSQLAKSSDAQALMSLLTKGHDRSALEQMAQSAVSGDVQSLRSLLQTITEDPQGAELLRRLSDSFQKE